MTNTTALHASDIVAADMVERESNGAIKAATVRYYISQRDLNGLKPYTLRVGRKIVLSRGGFAAWLATRVGA